MKERSCYVMLCFHNNPNFCCTNAERRVRGGEERCGERGGERGGKRGGQRSGGTNGERGGERGGERSGERGGDWWKGVDRE